METTPVKPGRPLGSMSNVRSERRSSRGAAFSLNEIEAKLKNKLWTLTFNLPGEKVNKLDPELALELTEWIEKLEEMGRAGRIDALIFKSGKPGNFIAGFDINVFETFQSQADVEKLCKDGHAMMNRWEDLPFPTIAAVNGAALGGGCELALACSAIVMSDDSQTRIGVPEVLLGVMPGLGGCVRLPQRLGLASALDLILTGRTLTGDKAYKSGLADACLPRQDFEASVMRWVESNIVALKNGKRLAKEPKLGGMGGLIGSAMERTLLGRTVIFRKAREGVISKTRGRYPAPLEAIDTLQANRIGFGPKVRGKERDRAISREIQGFAKLVMSEESRNLVRIFFMTEAVKKSNGLPGGSLASHHPVRSTAVLGAGTMGGGIAELFADKGISCRMKDLNTSALALGVEAATRILKKSVKKRKITPRQMSQKLGLISPVLDFSGFAGIDLVVEAVVEKLEVKKAVFKDLEAQVKPRCVIASNTSTLPITELQKGLQYPERFVGMHFFNPVHKMPLIEVIRGKSTSDEAVATVFQFAKMLGKTPIVVNDCAGFLVNRILCPYLNEAAYLVGDRVPVLELDKALLEFGMPMGPMELIDEVGIDIGDKALGVLYSAYGERMKPSALISKIVATGRLGKKTRKGMYVYEGGKNGSDRFEKVFDEEIYSMLEVSPKVGLVSNDEIVDRCILPMINEASRILDEKIVATAADVDLGMIMGTGFPPYRGGLMRYADAVGTAKLVDKLKKYSSRFGVRFVPSERLERMARTGERFYNK